MTTPLRTLHALLTVQRMTLPSSFEVSPEVSLWWEKTGRLLSYEFPAMPLTRMLSTPLKDSEEVTKRTAGGLRNYVDSGLRDSIDALAHQRLAKDENLDPRKYTLSKEEIEILICATEGVPIGQFAEALRVIRASIPGKAGSATTPEPFLRSILRDAPNEIRVAIDIVHAMKNRNNGRANAIALSYFFALMPHGPLAISTESIDTKEKGKMATLKSGIFGVSKGPDIEFAERPSVEPAPLRQEGEAGESGKVFVVHGHDSALKSRVKNLIRDTTSLHPVILHEMPSGGKTLIEKFESFSDVKFAVVLLTADDIGGKSDDSLRPRARQNVIFEMGFFYGNIGRGRVATLLDKGVERPSDVDGIVYLSTADDSWVGDLLSEFQNAGITVDWSAARHV